MMQYFSYKIAIALIHLLGPRGGYALARFVADQHYRSSPRDRRAVINNLRCILKERGDVRARARKVFHHFGEYLVDFFLMYRVVNERFVRDHVRVEGREHLERMLERGKGVLILTAHIGNWEMGAAVMNQLGHPLTAIALQHKNSKVNELFNRQREMQGVNVVPANVAVRRCIEALRRNQCVAVLGDRDFGSFGEPLPFFGRPTLIPKGAAFFANRTGAAIVPSFLIPDGNGNYVMSFEEPILPSLAGDDDPAADIALMRKYVAVIERKVRENPTQWLMFREFGIEYEDLSSDTRLQRSAGARTAR